VQETFGGERGEHDVGEDKRVFCRRIGLGIGKPRLWRRSCSYCPQAAVLRSRAKRLRGLRKPALVAPPLVGGGVP
jgi:hypothetical protein